MADRYWFRRNVLGPQYPVPITAERYEELRRARGTLIDAGAFEQRYELLLGNYLALEQFCTEWSLRSEVEWDYRYERWIKVIVEANRQVMNLLTAARSYADHVVRDFKRVDLSPCFHAQAELLMNEAYDRSASYRLICALRNHVQHRAPPVHGVSQGKKEAGWAESFVIYCDKQKLVEAGGFKASVLSELEEKSDLRRAARDFMREISFVHVTLRDAIKSACSNSRMLHERAIDEFVSAQGETSEGGGVGLTICREHDGVMIDVHPIMLDWDDVRILLAEKNRYQLNVGRRA